jgi:peptide/nickel transport system permease protein
MKAGALRSLYLPGGIVFAVLVIGLLAPILPLHDVTAMRIPERFSPPSFGHPLGQDEFGRDVFSRIVWGARASLTISIGAAFISAAIGTLLGLLGGYFRGVVEVISVRSTEIILCLPPLLLALLVVTLLGAGSTTLIVALSILYIPGYARVVFAATLQVRALDYVTAQEAMGTHPLKILWRTILPNIMGPLLVQISLTVASAMVLESGLSFLGLGVVPPSPSLGLMIRSARGAMDAAPLLLVWPSLALAGTILVLNMLCDRLRDVLDPRGAPSGGADWLRRGAGRLLPGMFKDATAGLPRSGLLDVRGLTVSLAREEPSGKRVGVDLVRDVDLHVSAGETLALVGESGSGKTLTGLSIMGLLPDGIATKAGEVVFVDEHVAAHDLTRLAEDDLRALRGSEISMVFQDASASLNPVHRIGDQLAEAIAAHQTLPAESMSKLVVEMLTRVGIPDAEHRRRAYPHELSGGQRQRAMIAMAVANRPRLLIADEPTTALDTTIQAQILKLLDGLKRSDGEMGMIFVTHNLAVVAEIADRICVMYAGEVVEDGPVSEVFARPRHPYTTALLASVPEGTSDRLATIPGTVPNAWEMPAGCRFAPRCAHAAAICEKPPPFERIGPCRRTRCVRWEEVT